MVNKKTTNVLRKEAEIQKLYYALDNSLSSNNHLTFNKLVEEAGVGKLNTVMIRAFKLNVDLYNRLKPIIREKEGATEQILADTYQHYKY